MENNSATTGHPISGVEDQTLAGTSTAHPAENPPIDEPDPLWSILYDRMLESYDKELIKRLHRSIRIQVYFATIITCTSFSFYSKIEKWVDPDYTQRLERLQMLQMLHQNSNHIFTMESLEALLALAPRGPPTPSTLVPCALYVSSGFIAIGAGIGAAIAQYMLSQYEGMVRWW